MDFQIKLILFAAITMAFIWLSRYALTNPRSHGFYRFIAFEATIALILLNLNHWVTDFWSPRQIISHVLLIACALLATVGWIALIRRGRIDSRRPDPALVAIEKTTRLVTDGIYRHLRHPMYAALLYLVCGVFLKRLSPVSITLAAVAIVFLYLTARVEETENVAYFGDPYRDYMKRSRMFIPYLF